MLRLAGASMGWLGSMSLVGNLGEKSSSHAKHPYIEALD